MRAYVVTIPGPAIADGPEDPESTKPPIRAYCGSKTEAAAQRTQWWNDGMSWKKSAITIEEVEIPTSKVALLAFINGVIDG